jgi:outer membrane cobalamin receptor
MRMNSRNRLFTLTLLLGLTAGLSQAEEDSVDLFDMDPSELYDMEVVSGTRSKRSLRELPMTVHVITAEDIRKNNYTSLVQALEDLPNIKASRPGNGTEGETFLQRGLFGNYYTKFLLDDVPINPVALSGFPISEQVNMRNVERIEVLYGAASAIYGADAVAGVVNIITKKPEGNEAQVTYKGGQNYNYGNVFGSYAVGEKENPVHLDLYGLYSQRDDWDIYDNYKEFLTPELSSW